MTAKGSPVVTPHDVRRFLLLLHEQGDTFEIRIPKFGKYKTTAAGYFDDAETALASVGAWDGRGNIYITPNPVNPALLARAANRIVERAEATTSDQDVTRRRWLFLDVDPTRPSGISSTEEELSAARSVATEVSDHLRGQEWPEPVVALSGNGYYVLYRVDLPNDEETTDLIRRTLVALAQRFDTDRAHVDQTVYNAARILALVGTMKVKGEDLPGRPHRRSRLESVPDSLKVVTREQLEAVATTPSRIMPPALRLVARSDRLVDLLDSRGIEYREQPPDAHGITWYHVRQCPFHEDGRPFECGVGQSLPDGPYAGHCFHPEGAGLGWHDFKRALGLNVDDAPEEGLACSGARPAILITNRHRREIAGDAWQALIKANDPVRFFRHGNAVAEIRKHEKGYPVIVHLDSAGLGGRLDRCANFLKLTDQGDRPARPPRDVVEDMQALEIPLPRLAGIVGTPVFTQDGVLVTSEGYQPETGLYYAPVGDVVPPVPAEPDETDLRTARTRLGQDLLGDFPWADDASRANVIAALVTPMARRMIAGPTPLFAFDAPKAGNGKGLLASCVGIVATGHEPPVMSDTRNEEEFRKRVTAKLIEGAGVVLFDNIRRRLDSGALAALLTSTVWSDRVLGRSQAVDIPVMTLWLLTGNNLQYSDELVRRAVSIRIDAKSDRPWERGGFRHPDLVGWLHRHRHEVVWACLVLVQNWIAWGRPDWTGSPMGSYESWCRVVGGILEAADIKGFLTNRQSLYRRGDAASQEWRSFTEAWWAQTGARPLRVADLQPLAEETLPSLFEEMKQGAGDRATRTRLGKALAERQDTRFGELFIRRAGDDAHAKTALWKVERAPGDDGSADVEARKAATPARHPHENDRFADSSADVADDAGVDSVLSPHMKVSSERDHLRERVGNAHPRYPHHPQPDSDWTRKVADDVRGTALAGEEHPQPAPGTVCAVCKWREAKATTSLGTVVCPMHRAEQERLEDRFGRKAVPR